MTIDISEPSVADASVPSPPDAGQADQRPPGRSPRKPGQPEHSRTGGQRRGKPAPAAAALRPRQHHPLLDRLAALHPRLFGRRFMPLKIGIFEDLVARHGDLLPAEELKAALAEHTRSTRYLESVAQLHPRCDLDGNPTEPVALEHVHYAIMEILRRRLQRGQRQAASDTPPATPPATPSATPPATPQADGGAQAWARERLAAAIEAAGVDRAAWADKVRTQDARALALAEEAFAELSSRQARREALLRAYDASGRGVDEFAQMYGMDAAAVSEALAWRARQRGLAG